MNEIDLNCKRTRIISEFLPDAQLQGITEELKASLNQQLINYLSSIGCIQTSPNEFSKGFPSRLKALIPRTNIHIQISRSVYDFIKLALFAYLMIKGELIGSAIGFADAIKAMKQRISRLEETSGELCVYKSIIASSNFIERDLGDRYPKLEVVFSNMIENRSFCREAKCKFNEDENCAVTKDEFFEIIEELKKSNAIIPKPDSSIWVVF